MDVIIFVPSINTNMQIQKITVRSAEKRSGEKNRLSPKLYIWVKNETILENLVNRRNRPFTEYKKHVIPKVMESLMHTHPHLHDRLKNAKWGWDKHCGCSMCPCSPGFIAKDIIEMVDIHVEI